VAASNSRPIFFASSTLVIPTACFQDAYISIPLVIRPSLGNDEGFSTAAMNEVILKRFENPDEVRTFEKGKFELVHLGEMTIGRASYEPGWKWSVHVGAAEGRKSCPVEHIGMVVSGRATAAMDDGRIIEMKPGDLFYIAPGHDSWVVGDEPYVSLHFLGAADYARHK
jgi:quercetin dioxygenase-like cupin family protein